MTLPLPDSEPPKLLRQDQIEETEGEIRHLKHMLSQPHLQNPGFVRKQVGALERMLRELTPQPFEGRELDQAVKQEAALREEIVGNGMPTHQEMRKNPPGAVHKHMTWENRNRKKLGMWKYLRRRLFAGSGDPDAANLERYRPKGGASGELAMDGAQIPGKSFFMPEVAPTPGAVMTDAESARLKEVDPELHDMMVALNGPQRAKVLEELRKLIAMESEAKEAKAVEAPPKRTLSEEHKAKLAEGRRKAAEAKAAKSE